MFQDVYIEKAVHRVIPTSTKIFNVVLLVLTVLVGLQFVFVSYQIFGLPFVGMLIASYFVTQNAKVDFDYVYTNGTLEITKILRKRKRKDLLECEMKDLVVVAKSKTEPVQAYVGRNMRTLDCGSHDPEIPYYTMIIKDHRSGAETKILFEPGDEMLEAIKRMYPDRVYI